MSKMKEFVLSLRYLPLYTRFCSVIFLFCLEEPFVAYFGFWGISSVLLLPGVLACWVFPWSVALAVEWGLLIIHTAAIVMCKGWCGYALLSFVAGIVTDIILVGSFGALRTAVDRSYEFHRIKDQFIANLNHDMRTPLTGAIGSLGILRDYGDRLSLTEQKMFLAQAQYSCQAIVDLTNNIKDAIDTRDDVSPPQIELFYLDIVVSELLRYIYTFEHPLTDLHLEEGVLVQADSVQVQRVLRNLLHNACKYSPVQSPISVHIGVCEGCSGYAYVCVADKGDGIPQEQIPQLFQKFSRLGESRIDGTGLGLYNCRRMVENMRGQIWVESSGIAGEGSRFYFTLPLCPEEAIPVTDNHRSIDTL